MTTACFAPLNTRTAALGRPNRPTENREPHDAIRPARLAILAGGVVKQRGRKKKLGKGTTPSRGALWARLSTDCFYLPSFFSSSAIFARSAGVRRSSATASGSPNSLEYW